MNSDNKCVKMRFLSSRISVYKRKKKEAVEVTKKDINIVEQELHFARGLAGNNLIECDKKLRKLRKWLIVHSKQGYDFTQDDFTRIWKGLFYFMWMSDKPLYQEEIAESLAVLIHCFDDAKNCINFFAGFLEIMQLEWNGIDNWRIDKFMMLVRRMLRQMLVYLHKREWKDELLDLFCVKVVDFVLVDKTPLGFSMHFNELILEELAKITNGNVKTKTVTQLIKPFILYIGIQRDSSKIKHTVKHIFNNLLFQSELGREYKEKYDKWKQMGFPGQSIDDLEAVAVEEDDQEKDTDDNEDPDAGKVLDPRAGRVDVYMPELPFDPLAIVNEITSIVTESYTNKCSRYYLKCIIGQYKQFASGVFPFGRKRIRITSEQMQLPSIEDKALEMEKFEEKLLKNIRKLKKMNKKARRRIIRQLGVTKKDVILYELNKARTKAQAKQLEKQEQQQPEDDTSVSEVQQKRLKKQIKLKKSDIPTNKATSVVLNDSAGNSDSSKLNESQCKKRKYIDIPALVENMLVAESELKSKELIDNNVSAIANQTIMTDKLTKLFQIDDDWNKPLQDDEIEHYLPAKKYKISVPKKNLRQESEASTPSPIKKKQKKMQLAKTTLHKNDDKSSQSITSLKQKQTLKKTSKHLRNEMSHKVSASPISVKQKKVEIKLDLTKTPSLNQYNEMSPKVSASPMKQKKVKVELESFKTPSSKVQQQDDLNLTKANEHLSKYNKKSSKVSVSSTEVSVKQQKGKTELELFKTPSLKVQQQQEDVNLTKSNDHLSKYNEKSSNLSVSSTDVFVKQQKGKTELELFKTPSPKVQQQQEDVNLTKPNDHLSKYNEKSPKVSVSSTDVFVKQQKGKTELESFKTPSLKVQQQQEDVNLTKPNDHLSKYNEKSPKVSVSSIDVFVKQQKGKTELELFKTPSPKVQQQQEDVNLTKPNDHLSKYNEKSSNLSVSSIDVFVKQQKGKTELELFKTPSPNVQQQQKPVQFAKSNEQLNKSAEQKLTVVESESPKTPEATAPQEKWQRMNVTPYTIKINKQEVVNHKTGFLEQMDGWHPIRNRAQLYAEFRPRGLLPTNHKFAHAEMSKILSRKGTPVQHTHTRTPHKKVHINVDMNQSQDTNEYLRQLRRSPMIPFDSTKKPIKGVLKSNKFPTLINPYFQQNYDFLNYMFPM